jgi:hypothetical protein
MLHAAVEQQSNNTNTPAFTKTTSRKGKPQRAKASCGTSLLVLSRSHLSHLWPRAYRARGHVKGRSNIDEAAKKTHSHPRATKQKNKIPTRRATAASNEAAA